VESVPGKVPLAPLAGAVNVTVTPDTALPPLSVTTACNVAKAVLTGTLWGVPEEVAIVAAEPAVLVKENAAGVPTPPTVAFTTYDPTIELAANVGAVAIPLESVVTVALAVPPLNVPLAPLAGAVNVTDAPDTPAPLPSLTVACKVVANAALILAFCGVPAVAATLDAPEDTPVPLRDTVPCALAVLSPKTKVELLCPAAVGLKFTPTKQLLPAATIVAVERLQAGDPLVGATTKKSPEFPLDTVKLLMVSESPLELLFVIWMFVTALVTPTWVFANVTLPGVALAVGWLPAAAPL
jgi:hypothetical protein